LICAFSTARICRVSTQITGNSPQQMADPLRRASEAIGGRIAAALTEKRQDQCCS